MPVLLRSKFCGKALPTTSLSIFLAWTGCGGELDISCIVTFRLRIVWLMLPGSLMCAFIKKKLNFVIWLKWQLHHKKNYWGTIVKQEWRLPPIGCTFAKSVTFRACIRTIIATYPLSPPLLIYYITIKSYFIQIANVDCL